MVVESEVVESGGVVNGGGVLDVVVVESELLVVDSDEDDEDSVVVDVTCEEVVVPAPGVIPLGQTLLPSLKVPFEKYSHLRAD